jgi:CDP-glycerol glycerophosphotransferase (TagB/SpsB family)
MSAAQRMTVDAADVDVERRSVIVSGRYSGAAPTIELSGGRQQLVGTVTAGSGRFTAVVPLETSHWQGPVLPARSGEYTLADIDLADELALPAPQLIEGVTRVRFERRAAELAVILEPPLTDRERGPLQQAALESDYRATDFEPIDAVFFESFYGRNASCNPLAIDRAIAAQLPHVRRYWSVADASVQVPEGATAIIDGSAEWWRIRGSARLLVVNDWLRKRYKRRRHQSVLQTWHGTMLKKLALSRSGQGVKAAIATLLESRRWTVLLAQNDHSRRVFRRAYAYRGPIWEVGYPRDDVLLTGDAAEVRRQLGIPNGTTVVLYAPTWRDDHPDQVDHLDVARFAARLGDGYVTLIRGHSRTLVPGEAVRAPGVIDVTGFADVSQLFLAADALVTDYSSVMFDFTVTGKPVFFFTPDLQHYRQTLRGFYFDLVAVAPGPVVSTLDELVELVRRRDELAPEFAERYQAWRTRFNPRDDGHAAERVVELLRAEGLLG